MSNYIHDPYPDLSHSPSQRYNVVGGLGADHCVTGPAVGPKGRGHLHRVACGPRPMAGALGDAGNTLAFMLFAGAVIWFSLKATKPKPRKNPKLRSAQRRRMASAKFAMPALRKLPINDAGHIRSAMSRFGQVKGATRAQKRGAYRRIVRAAHEKGINPSGFVARWGGRYR